MNEQGLSQDRQQEATLFLPGQQGQAAIAAFANNSQYQIRGLTRNPSSAAAKDLAAKGIEVVRADINNIDTITAAFRGSHIIFAVIDFWTLYQQQGYEKAKELERQQGINMVKAAAAVLTLEHYIWSTLGKTKQEHPVYHFEGKFDVEQTIRAEYPDLHAKTTFLLVCFYANNLQIASLRLYWIETAGKYIQFTTYDPETVIPFIGDKVRNGAMVIASIAQWTARKWVEEWARAKGKMVQLEFALMMDYFRFVPVQEWVEPGVSFLTAEDLGVRPVQTMEEWART
ncbi:NmrA/HSCARG family protein [Aspergillus foveolatus]|uniref:NmrA/HSCARG family protein n=1 Tax=Aspergillus foveolatus TaxID=210207 RepID=UPI003CCD3721